MSEATEHFDVVVIGCGPAGQKAAIQGAKIGRRVLVVERHPRPGGECVRRGTIPSKTLQAAAMAVRAMRSRIGVHFDRESIADVPLHVMMSRVDEVVSAHERYMADQLQRNHVEVRHGRARFLDERRLEIRGPVGGASIVSADLIIIATGSRPRDPSEIPVDHEHVLDSDSILSLQYRPASLTVLGAGVIACEYASIFANLGSRVTIVDRGPLPLGFLDPELSNAFRIAIEAVGGTYVGDATIAEVAWDGVAEVATRLADGREIRSEAVLFALGRVADLRGLDIAAAGLETTPRGVLAVDANGRTKVPHIYAVGDVVGPPGLAASAMEQGRRAVAHAFDLPLGDSPGVIPTGIYTIPEIASVGLSEPQARAEYGEILVGRADFGELARGQIARQTEGFLKLVADEEGESILGVEVFGEGATELIHMGQIAMLSHWTIDAFVENIFNFPTLAEAYRVAALDVVKQRALLPV